MSRWLAILGLTIHPDKTRLCSVWEEPFDFLEHTFRSHRRFRTGRRILTAHPSRKAQRRLKEKVNALLYRGNPKPWPELREQLNRLIAGWANYFSFGWTPTADAAIWWHVAGRARRFLCRRHKLRPQGAARFSAWEVYGPAGVLDICEYWKRSGRLANASS